MVEFRCMLHPTLTRDWKYTTDNWFPGMRHRHKQLRDAESKNKATIVERRVVPKQYFETKLFKYNEADVQEARSKPIVRCGSRYIDPDRKDRQEQL